MKNNILTLVVGLGLIISAVIPIDEKPVNLNYQITTTAIGVVVCCAALIMIIQDNIKEHIDEKIKK